MNEMRRRLITALLAAGIIVAALVDARTVSLERTDAERTLQIGRVRRAAEAVDSLALGARFGELSNYDDLVASRVDLLKAMIALDKQGPFDDALAQRVVALKETREARESDINGTT
ncbi:MAG TPA: hypothetical protein VGO62_13085, partial [Myxococcota bacterium]